MRKIIYVVGIAVAGCLISVPVKAGVISYGSIVGTLINFDTLTGSPTLGAGEVLANQYAGQGVTFAAPGFHAYATNGVLATDSLLTSLPNVIWVDQGGGSGSGLDIFFSTPQSAVGLYFELSSSTATIAVYNGATLLESFTSGSAAGGTALEGYLALQDANITEAIVYSTSPGGTKWNFSIDNLKFGTASTTAEPSSMLLIGAGLAAAALLKLRK